MHNCMYMYMYITFLIFFFGVAILLGFSVSGSRLRGGGALLCLTAPLALSQLSSKFLILCFDDSYKENLIYTKGEGRGVHVHVHCI